jgi:hypothetical protein
VQVRRRQVDPVVICRDDKDLGEGRSCGDEERSRFKGYLRAGHGGAHLYLST